MNYLHVSFGWLSITISVVFIFYRIDLVDSSCVEHSSLLHVFWMLACFPFVLGYFFLNMQLNFYRVKSSSPNFLSN